MRESVGRCDFLICTGGIGPTEDDLTRQALAAVMKVPLDLDEQWLKFLRDFFAQRNRPMPESNTIQAMIPRGAKRIDNDNGTAAGIDAVYMTGDLKNACRVFVLPGVPMEMTAMFDRDVLPHVASETGGAVVLSRTLHTLGLGESAVAEKLGALMSRARNPSVGTTVANGIVSLRVNASFDSRDQAQRQLDETERACRAALGELIFGADSQTIQEVVGQLLASSGKTVATAESCTGGLLAKMLTDVPGSSQYFQTGFVTYSNRAKYDRLGVSLEVINTYGAVSEPVVSAMAKNARRLAKSDFALAISGVAGPTGGSATKPVGMVCLALAFDDEAPPIVRTFNFAGGRETIRDRAAKMALTFLRFHLLGRRLPF
jgi:nicotinamide-nucleotide amidase